jgi:hypothetical protein
VTPVGLPLTLALFGGAPCAAEQGQSSPPPTHFQIRARVWPALLRRPNFQLQHLHRIAVPPAASGRDSEVRVIKIVLAQLLGHVPINPKYYF